MEQDKYTLSVVSFLNSVSYRFLCSALHVPHPFGAVILISSSAPERFLGPPMARVLEETLYREVASVAAAFELRSSRWNAGVGSARTIFEVRTLNRSHCAMDVRPRVKVPWCSVFQGEWMREHHLRYHVACYGLREVTCFVPRCVRRVDHACDIISDTPVPDTIRESQVRETCAFTGGESDYIDFKTALIELDEARCPLPSPSVDNKI